MEDHVFSRCGSSSSAKTSSSDMQLADCAPDAFQLELHVNPDLKPTSSTSAVEMDHNAHVPVNCISPKAAAFLAAAEAAVLLRADEMDAGNVTPFQSSLADLHDPERFVQSFAPPKKFYRRHWQSVSPRLLTQAGRPSDAQPMA